MPYHRPTRVPPSVKRAITNELREPQLAEVAAHFFHAAGGPKRVAKLLYEEFIQAKPGTLIRQRILDMVLRATKYANEKSGPQTDLGLMSDEDLEREAESVLRLAQGEDDGAATRPAAAQPEAGRPEAEARPAAADGGVAG